jgi:hypothetical protein
MKQGTFQFREERSFQIIPADVQAVLAYAAIEVPLQTYFRCFAPLEAMMRLLPNRYRFWARAVKQTSSGQFSGMEKDPTDGLFWNSFIHITGGY